MSSNLKEFLSTRLRKRKSAPIEIRLDSDPENDDVEDPDISLELPDNNRYQNDTKSNERESRSASWSNEEGALRFSDSGLLANRSQLIRVKREKNMRTSKQAHEVNGERVISKEELQIIKALVWKFKPKLQKFKSLSETGANDTIMTLVDEFKKLNLPLKSGLLEMRNLLSNQHPNWGSKKKESLYVKMLKRGLERTSAEDPQVGEEVEATILCSFGTQAEPSKLAETLNLWQRDSPLRKPDWIRVRDVLIENLFTSFTGTYPRSNHVQALRRKIGLIFRSWAKVGTYQECRVDKTRKGDLILNSLVYKFRTFLSETSSMMDEKSRKKLKENERDVSKIKPGMSSSSTLDETISEKLRKKENCDDSLDIVFETNQIDPGFRCDQQEVKSNGLNKTRCETPIDKGNKGDRDNNIEEENYLELEVEEDQDCDQATFKLLGIRSHQEENTLLNKELNEMRTKIGGLQEHVENLEKRVKEKDIENEELQMKLVHEKLEARQIGYEKNKVFESKVSEYEATCEKLSNENKKLKDKVVEDSNKIQAMWKRKLEISQQLNHTKVLFEWEQQKRIHHEQEVGHLRLQIQNATHILNEKSLQFDKMQKQMELLEKARDESVTREQQNFHLWKKEKAQISEECKKLFHCLQVEKYKSREITNQTKKENTNLKGLLEEVTRKFLRLQEIVQKQDPELANKKDQVQIIHENLKQSCSNLKENYKIPQQDTLKNDIKALELQYQGRTSELMSELVKKRGELRNCRTVLDQIKSDNSEINKQRPDKTLKDPGREKLKKNQMYYKKAY